MNFFKSTPFRVKIIVVGFTISILTLIYIIHLKLNIDNSALEKNSGSIVPKTEVIVADEIPAQIGGETNATNINEKVGEDIKFIKNLIESKGLESSVKEFKAHPGFRVKSAEKLFPYLENGMSTFAITELLGEPNAKKSHIWHYTVFYSKFIEIHFDEANIVTNVIEVGVVNHEINN